MSIPGYIHIRILDEGKSEVTPKQLTEALQVAMKLILGPHGRTITMCSNNPRYSVTPELADIFA